MSGTHGMCEVGKTSQGCAESQLLQEKSNAEHLQPFLLSNTEESTIPRQLLAVGPPSLSREENVLHAFHW